MVQKLLQKVVILRIFLKSVCYTAGSRTTLSATHSTYLANIDAINILTFFLRSLSLLGCRDATICRVPSTANTAIAIQSDDGWVSSHHSQRPHHADEDCRESFRKYSQISLVQRPQHADEESFRKYSQISLVQQTHHADEESFRKYSQISLVQQPYYHAQENNRKISANLSSSTSSSCR